MNDEREAFEAWAKSMGLHMNHSRRTAGMYEAMDTNLLWEGWSARAAIAVQKPSPQPPHPECDGPALPFGVEADPWDARS